MFKKFLLALAMGAFFVCIGKLGTADRLIQQTDYTMEAELYAIHGNEYTYLTDSGDLWVYENPKYKGNEVRLYMDRVDNYKHNDVILSVKAR